MKKTLSNLREYIFTTNIFEKNIYHWNLRIIIQLNIQSRFFFLMQRAPESPLHKPYESGSEEGGNIFNLPPAPSHPSTKARPPEQPKSPKQPAKDFMPLNLSEQGSKLAPSSSTPFEISDQGVSEEITFNSNDCLSFADSLVNSDEDDEEKNASIPPMGAPPQPQPAKIGEERLLLLPSPPAAAQSYVNESDESESIISEMEGLNEDGVYVGDSRNQTKQQPIHRPPSGVSSVRSSTRSNIVSGIPRPIRSRSNSLYSDASSSGGGSSSRRNSNGKRIFSF